LRNIHRIINTHRARGAAAILIATALFALSFSPPRAQPAKKPPLIIIGFDGADFHITDKLLKEGRLPNLKKLADQGSFRPLTVTNPPQTPVSWSTFATGMNPGRTEIFDFLKREGGSYHPAFALNEETKRPFTEVAPVNVRLWLIVAGVVLGAAAGHLLKKKLGMAKALIATALIAGGVIGAGSYLTGLWLPQQVPWPRNNRKGEPFWVTAAKHGVRTRVLRVPATFPADGAAGLTQISGLGVPDVRGGIGTPVVYTTDPLVTATSQEFSVDIISLQPEAGGFVHPLPNGATEPLAITGPANKIFFDYVVDASLGEEKDPAQRQQRRETLEKQLRDEGVPKIITVPLKLTQNGATVCYEYQAVKRCLKEKEWSDFEPVKFKFSPLVTITGFTRFRILSLSPHVTFYMSPINFHPDTHPLPLSYPPEFAGQVAKRFGLYKTIGWLEDIWTTGAGVMDEKVFLEDAALTRDQFGKIMQGLLKDNDYDLHVQVFEFTDRIAHILWRYTDPQHPGYKGREAQAAIYGPEIEKAYVDMDTLVGQAMAAAPPDSHFIVLSDHGFTSFRRSVNYNTWLAQHGYITFKGQNRMTSVKDLFDNNAILFSNVDWSRTKAYGLGLGNIYINLAGREPSGIVFPGKEYDEIVAGIRSGLESLVDPDTKEKPVFKVYTRDEMYSGYDPMLIPDLRVANNPNYRVSWQTSLGAAPDTLIEDNLQPWSGDHCSMDPSFVPGIFFSDMPGLAEHPAMTDLTPTILHYFNVEPAQKPDGKPLY
jgi:predicted AlkP superfamily phosphohydrolase/phosphomutase